MNESAQEFLKEIGVTLPKPRVMEGFGTELPEVYMGRCMDVLIPAVKVFCNKQKDVILQDFLEYVKEYKVPFVKLVHREAVQKHESVITPTVTDSMSVKSEDKGPDKWADFSRKTKMEMIQKWFDEHPGASREEGAAALNVSVATVFRFLKMARDEMKMVRDGKQVKDSSLPKATSSSSSSSSARKSVVIRPVKEEPAPAYKEGGYMASLRMRFDNRNNEKEESLAAEDKPAGVLVAKEDLGKNIRFNSFFLLNCFSKLSAEVKEKAIAERWNVADAGSDNTKELVAKFSKKGLRLCKSKLTMMEYVALKDLLTQSMSYVDMARRYPEYLAKM